MMKFFPNSRKEAVQSSSTHFERELSLCYLHILTFSMMSLGIDLKKRKTLPIDPNWLGRNGTAPNPNFILQSMLVQVVNYSLAIIHLVEDGLDNPARCVLRALNELASQCIVLLSDRDQLATYASAHTADEAKSVWYKLLAKKGKLKKSLSKLELQLGIPEQIVPDLKVVREQIDLEYSQAVHHSYSSTLVKT